MPLSIEGRPSERSGAAPALLRARDSPARRRRRADAVRRGDQHGCRLDGPMPQLSDRVSAAHPKAAGGELPLLADICPTRLRPARPGPRKAADDTNESQQELQEPADRQTNGSAPRADKRHTRDGRLTQGRPANEIEGRHKGNPLLDNFKFAVISFFDSLLSARLPQGIERLLG